MTTGANAGALAARLMLDTNGFQASMAAAGQVSERELKRIQRQVKFVSDYVQEMAKAQRVANNATDMTKATQQMRDFGLTAELSQKQITRASQILPAQITDIVTSLASGQKPWLVAIQQGGQIKDMYGGIGNALKAVSALITPASIAFGVLGGAVIAAGTAMYQGAMAAIRFRDDTILSGNAAGMTASRFDAVAERISRASAQTVGASKDILSELISSGKTSSAVIEGQALAIARIADLSGKDAAKIAETFTDQMTDMAANEEARKFYEGKIRAVFAPAEVTWISKSMGIVGAFLLTWDSLTRKPSVGTIPTSALPLNRAKIVQSTTVKGTGYTVRLTRPAKIVDTEIN